MRPPAWRAEVEAAIAGSGAEAVAVVYEVLVGAEKLMLRPDMPFHAASTMKVAVLAELFHQAALGELDLTETVPIRNQFVSIADGGFFALDPADDSEPTLYRDLGGLRSLIDLARPMITHSSNLATNLLVDRLGAARITAFMTELGADGLTVLRGVEDGAAYRRGLNNTATARSLTTLLKGIAHGEVVSAAASAAMLEILAAQTHRNALPAGLPAGTTVANKPGWNAGIAHDCGIVFREGRPAYALSVLTRGLGEADGPELIAAISGIAFRGHQA